MKQIILLIAILSPFNIDGEQEKETKIESKFWYYNENYRIRNKKTMHVTRK